MGEQLLIVFVKAPRVGEVKPRLARTIGALAARDAYCRLVDSLFDNLSSLNEVQLRVTPDDALDEVRRWRRDSWTVRPQGEGDLGQRLETAFADAFGCGARRVVIIGSECPWIRAREIERGWAQIESFEGCLGPERNGGD